MLKNRNIRNLLLGRLVSTSGDSLYQVAVIWYIFELSQDAFYTGLAAAIVMIPKCLNFLLGPVIDSLNKLQVLIYAQYAQFLLMAAIPASIYLGVDSLALVLTVLFLVSFLENFQGTAEIAVVPKLVPAGQRGHFNSLAGSSQQIIDLLMKAVFAGAILLVGVGPIFLYNALTYLGAALFFSLLRRGGFEANSYPASSSGAYAASLKEGFTYFFTTKIALICLPFLIANFSFGMTNAILPVYAAERGGSELYGYLILGITAGNLLGSMLVVKVLKYPLGRLMIVLPLLSFVMWAWSVVAGNVWQSVILLGLAFIPFGMMSILLITFLQTSIDEDMLARVSSIIDSILVSAMPLGAVLGGALAQTVGAGGIMLAGSFGLAVIAGYFLFNKTIRSLPAVETAGLQRE